LSREHLKPADAKVNLCFEDFSRKVALRLVVEFSFASSSAPLVGRSSTAALLSGAITPFLNGERFDPETSRVLGVALEMVCIALRTGDCADDVKQAIAGPTHRPCQDRGA
jgi:hypothetical protein